MSLLSRIIILLILAVIIILLTVILGDYGPWYLAWFLGTGFMVPVSAMGGVLFENQEQQENQKAQQSSSQPKG